MAQEFREAKVARICGAKYQKTEGYKERHCWRSLEEILSPWSVIYLCTHGISSSSIIDKMSLLKININTEILNWKVRAETGKEKQR